jgi:hypothetical protein
MLEDPMLYRIWDILLLLLSFPCHQINRIPTGPAIHLSVMRIRVKELVQ